MAEYQKEINDIKDKWCRGEAKKKLPGPVDVYCRPNYSFTLDNFAENKEM